MWVLRGNATEHGDDGGGPGQSSLFFLTVHHPENKPDTSVGSGALSTSLENPWEGIILTPGRTHNRSRSPRIGSKGWARWALGGRPGSRSPLAGQPAGGFQHPGADALSRLRPSGVRLTTNLELVRTGGI
ncbi:hypothetical protein F5144DRAFT_595793 [Chaetomium tenue]|uniref:Uncharacterized protein n=2 Tax=Chaetomium tenue TaxID=1854479 RepID=A0ACB7NZ49_9PEZI|nr:hypothetical protein F5144DRAFT_497314 [Chaetomium globosum]KAH6623664.1 hypothetical protein F5144DRAFT_595793 [Chaetomium globosum]